MNPLVALTTLFAAAQASLIGAPYATSGYGLGLPYAAAPYAPISKPYGYATQSINPIYGKAAIAAPAYAAPYGNAYGAPYAKSYAYAPIATPSTQYAAKDVLGNVKYGYSDINSAKQEVRNAYGETVGSYSYRDANGQLQQVNYVAGPGGFRVSGTNLPVAPAVPDTPELMAPVFDLEAPVDTGVAPEPVQDTAEVAAAKAEFQAAFDAAAAAGKHKRSTPASTKLIAAPYGYSLPLAAPYGLGLGLGGYGGLGLGLGGYGGLGYNGLGLGYAGLGLGYSGY